MVLIGNRTVYFEKKNLIIKSVVFSGRCLNSLSLIVFSEKKYV